MERFFSEQIWTKFGHGPLAKTFSNLKKPTVFVFPSLVIAVGHCLWREHFGHNFRGQAH